MTHQYEGHDIPVWGYGIEADTYEEAYELAKRMFNEDYAESIRENRAEILQALAEEWGVVDF